MKIEQLVWGPGACWTSAKRTLGDKAQWVLVLGAPEALRDPDTVAQLGAWYPEACIVGCSTAGEICGTRVQDNTLVATAVHFEHTSVRLATASVNSPQDSHAIGASLAAELSSPDLVHVMVLSDGLNINGSALAKGVNDHLPANVAVTGGLAGDGARFERTLIRVGNTVSDRLVVAIGFYGDRLRVGFGSLGGWESFGPEQLVTRSEGNVLYELDGQPALDLYTRHMRGHGADLPASALQFPLGLRANGSTASITRTVLAVDLEHGSMTFAGDIQQGAQVRLMKSNHTRLVHGAAGAANASIEGLGNCPPELAILISCIGRKLVLKQRTEEEVETIRDLFGSNVVLAGFYAYGEICPQGTAMDCDLHNQTMTVTTFAEAPLAIP